MYAQNIMTMMESHRSHNFAKETTTLHSIETLQYVFFITKLTFCNQASTEYQLNLRTNAYFIQLMMYSSSTTAAKYAHPASKSDMYRTVSSIHIYIKTVIMKMVKANAVA